MAAVDLYHMNVPCIHIPAHSMCSVMAAVGGHSEESIQTIQAGGHAAKFEFREVHGPYEKIHVPGIVLYV